jgi:hypothetical protein
MALNQHGLRTIKTMLQIVAGEITNIDAVPDDQKALFSREGKPLREAAIDELARHISHMGSEYAETREK